MNELISVIISAMLPISELRGAIPLAVNVYRWPIWQAYLIAVVANLVPVVLILFFLEPISEWFRHKSNFAERFFSWIFERTRYKHKKRFIRWGDLALISFVAIPLPFTGAWTGALAAFLFGIKPQRSITLIFVGILIAGIIVSVLSFGLLNLV